MGAITVVCFVTSLALLLMLLRERDERIATEPLAASLHNELARTERLWSSRSGESLTVIKQTRFPVSVAFQGMDCVSLRLRRGRTGISPVYCYRVKDRKLVIRHDFKELR